MHVPAAGEHIRNSRAAHEARKIAVTAADLLHRAAHQHHHVGWLDPRARLERELALARTVFDFECTQRQTKPHDIAAQNFEYGIELVVTQFSEMLIALREETDLGRRPGLAGIVERKPRVFELENMKCHFEPRHVVETGFAQPLQRAPVQIASRDGNRLAAGEIQIAQQPSRAYSPRQDMERGWVGNNDYAGDRRLAAQHSMLIGKREPDDFQLVRLDELLDLVRGFRPLVGPQTMTFDETHCAPRVRMRHSLFKVSPGRRHHSTRCIAAQAEPLRRLASNSRQYDSSARPSAIPSSVTGPRMRSAAASSRTISGRLPLAACSIASMRIRR